MFLSNSVAVVELYDRSADTVERVEFHDLVTGVDRARQYAGEMGEVFLAGQLVEGTQGGSSDGFITFAPEMGEAEDIRLRQADARSRFSEGKPPRTQKVFLVHLSPEHERHAPEEVREYKILDLELNDRIRDALSQQGMTTVGSLLDAGEASLKKLPGIGKVSMEQVKEQLFFSFELELPA